ncbi:DUF4167 domain-containing protein [Sphingomonas sp. SUN039]|uniref:DUF4167 domain-containing protein n=1 Tax=Sphingomonas sp. SUN039 TaxID=2937787 RepID=UPI002164E713|nr:DUF4167 domain-containing protein [Sphingomonas sp. SUN039]UVO55575.1 DUF4167 domain-containing protein [Sphingomonas sp. SUN039]
MINNRQQSGRRRGRGGQNGQRQQNGRPELGNRIDNRARGNAPQLLEKYKTLARDAQQSGDRVLAEYYFQFADHYFRVLAESRARYEEANPNRPRQDYAEPEEQFDEDGNEIEREFDARPPQQARQDRPERQEQAPRQYRDNQNRDDRPREDRPRDDRPREDRPRQDRYQRDDRPREDRAQREDRPQRDVTARDDRPQREERPRLERTREDGESRRPRARSNGNGASHDDDDSVGVLPFDALPPAIGVAAMEPEMGVEGEEIAVPKKRGRPKKVVEATEGE